MKRTISILLVLILVISCSKPEDSNVKEPTQEEPTTQLEGTWEYFRGVELRCGELKEVGEFSIDNYNRNTWKKDGSFYREYMEDDGTTSSYSGKWTLLKKEGESYVYKTEIEGISGSDTTYIIFNGANKILNYDKKCFSVPYDPYTIREAGEARKVE